MRLQYNTTGKKDIVVHELAKNLRTISAEIMSSQASNGSSSSSDCFSSGEDDRDFRILPDSLVKDAAINQMAKKPVRAQSFKKEEKGCLIM